MLLYPYIAIGYHILVAVGYYDPIDSLWILRELSNIEWIKWYDFKTRGERLLQILINNLQIIWPVKSKNPKAGNRLNTGNDHMNRDLPRGLHGIREGGIHFNQALKKGGNPPVVRVTADYTAAVIGLCKPFRLTVCSAFKIALITVLAAPAGKKKQSKPEQEDDIKWIGIQ
jgi:hypothetical protein